MLLLPRKVFAASSEAIAETEAGRVRGVRNCGVEIYRGVPYGGSVAGEGRFKVPPPPRPWHGIRDASRPGPPSVQPLGGTFGINEPAPAEDCLTLTVWTPAADFGKRPVMFYNHGGGFATGSCASVIQDGANLAREQDVVVVASNHRLGLLGYLFLEDLGGAEYAGSGNQGLLDIAAALRWTYSNIGRFGGDPGNIMIFGESGGGAKTSCLYAMPSVADTFTKASIESGPGICMSTPDASVRTRDRVLKELAISRGNWQMLHKVPAETLLAVQLKISGLPNSGALAGDKRGINDTQLGFGPFVDGKVLPAHPFDPVPPAFSRKKPLIVGYNHDEFAFFALFGKDYGAFTLDDTGLKARLSKEMPDDYQSAVDVYRQSRPTASPSDIYIAIRSARFAGTGSILIAERKAAQQGAPAFAYVFNYQLERLVPGTDRPIGAMHALEIPFKFNNVASTAIPGQPNMAGDRPARIAAGRNMSSLWAGFARSGVPTASGVPAWTPYSVDTRATMIIDDHCQLVDDPNKIERVFWEARPS